MDDEPELAVDEFVDYCRTQAGLLSGRVETMGAEADRLLDEVDEAVAAVREQLDGREGVEGTETPASAGGPDAGVDVAAIEERQADLEEKQALVEAKQARMQAFQELAAGYVELAEELADLDDGREALDRVVRFEADRDAPAYFEERRTVVEAAAESADR